MATLRLDHVSHTYVTKEGAFPALTDITIDVREGEFLALIGPSGCGKTTLLSLIAGIIQPTEGSVSVNAGADHCLSNIGYMLQHDYLFPWLSIEKNIILGQKILGTYSKKSEKMAFAWLEKMGLGDKLHEVPAALSGGMRQRVALVRMLATNPALMLLDEPFSALDQQTKLKLEDLVAETLKAEKKTAILVTHDISEAIAMSDRIVLLSPRPGRVAQIFSIPNELKKLSPFEARQHPMFSEQFQLIWKELERLEHES
ncbi:ABC transporter ATP-binding protein [Shouchella shacheensis]|uniref:ABC transporter ATP-binding protein n=1 Tax=Shouchella shacheensis TaxID=1649580 RepID=UPI00073FEAF8|nr:ABC transporter ATP-binding protein [Shouchella shacheensis]